MEVYVSTISSRNHKDSENQSPISLLGAFGYNNPVAESNLHPLVATSSIKERTFNELFLEFV